MRRVLRRQSEGRAHDIHPPAVERAQVERREQPLVRVDDQRVGAIDARQHVPVGRQHRRDAAVRGVHVQPQPLALADVRNRRHRIDAGRRRGAHGGDDGDRQHARRAVVGDRALESIGPQPEFGIDRNPPKRFKTESVAISALSIEECA